MGVSTKTRSGNGPSSALSTEALEDATGLEDLLAEHLTMIEGIARQFASNLPAYIDIDDLVVAGALGFVEAVERYDASLRVSLRHYASIRVRGAIQDELRHLDWMPRSIRQITTQLDRLTSVVEHQNCRRATDTDLAQALGVESSCFRELLAKNPVYRTVSLDKLNSGKIPPIEKELWDSLGKASATLPSELENASLGEELTLVMDALNDQQQLVMQLYYFGDLTMREIGEQLGLSEGRICQIHAQSLDVMRKRMENLKKESSPGD